MGNLIPLLLVLLVIIIWANSTAVYYFDYNGTCPQSYTSSMATLAASRLGNASSSYAHEAKARLEHASNLIRQWAGMDSSWKIIYTSGASESNNQILRSYSSVALGSTEHKTSLECVAANHITTTILPCLRDGSIDPAEISKMSTRPQLISIMAANNETGTINNLPALYRACQQIGVPFHVDAVQTFGKYPDIARMCDAFSVSFHKLGGPTGVGLLCYNPKIKLLPLISGTQSDGLRGGTDNVSGIVGAAAALQTAMESRLEKNISMKAQCDHILSNLPYTAKKLSDFDSIADKSNPFESTPRGQIYYVLLSGPVRLPNTLFISFMVSGPKMLCNLILRDRLEKLNCIVSIGSACSKGGPSHVLKAIGAPFVVRRGAIRISLGDDTSFAACNYLLAQLDKAIREQM